jgi:uncharacterized membrane protein
MDPAPSMWQTRAGRVLAGAVGVLLVATLVGLAVLWPGDGPPLRADAPQTLGAEVRAVDRPDCGGPQRQACLRIAVEVEGRTERVTLGPVGLAPDLRPGDDVRLVENAPPPGTTEASIPGFERFSFSGVDRRTPLLVLLVLVAVAAVALVAWRGLLALVGLGLSLLLVTEFLLPAILEGRDPLAVALVGAMAVTFVTVVLTSGIGAQTLAAMLGIALTLALAAVGAVLVVDVAALDGRSSELSSALAVRGESLSLEAVVVAGAVLGVLGALTDTAVTQASAVMALRRAAPDLGARRLYAEAFAVGRDHLAATIHTLALAYAGATLPLLLALRADGTTLPDALAVQDLAEPVAGILLGSLALLACVPVSTGLAALLAVRIPAASVPAGHGHAH